MLIIKMQLNEVFFHLCIKSFFLYKTDLLFTVKSDAKNYHF